MMAALHVLAMVCLSISAHAYTCTCTCIHAFVKLSSKHSVLFKSYINYNEKYQKQERRETVSVVESVHVT